jgi:ATP-dependent helicase HepA
MELVTNINQSIADGRNELIPEYVKSLHRHISETYRIHQRLIRTRRRDLVDGGMNDRQSVFHTFAEDEDDRSPKLVDLLDVWRIHSLEGLENTSEANRSEYELRMAERYAALHEALGISVEKYEEELTKQIDDIKQGRELTFDQDEYDLTIARDVTQEHTEFTRLDMAASLVRTAIDRIASITPQPKIVAFSSSTEFASELADSLGYQLICKVFRVNQFSTDEEVQEAYTGFASSREAAVLVCDQRGEEGLNLQFAQGIVHLDLPLMPDRIEQRIGRLDRVGRKELNRASSAFTQDIHYWVLSPFHDTVHPWERWHELLRDGFKVFEQSISEVQFLLDDLHLTVKLALYRRGSAGLKDLENNILESIAQERERLDEQYALDSRSIISEDTNDAFTEIVKTDSPVHFRPLNNWLTRVLQVGRFSIDGLPTCFEYKWLDQTLLPKINPRQVIDPESFNGKLTYNRSVAAFTRGIRLVRPGLELVDQIEDYLMTCDDRGTAFATWKTDPEWTGEGRSQWLGFRLTFLLEANIDTAVSKLNQIIGDLQTTSLRRRMDSLLPPWSTTLYVDIDMKPVKDILLSDILERPYSSNRDSFGRRDFNLGSRLDVLYDAIGYDELASACDKAKETSELILRGSDEFQEWVMSHAERAIHQTKADSERLTRRQEVVIRETGTADSWIERDIVLNSGIISALGEPSVRLDSIGLFVVSDKDPNQEGMGT